MTGTTALSGGYLVPQNWTLHKALQRMGIRHSREMCSGGEGYDYEEPVEVVRVGKRLVGFDRWGYCSENDGVLDQAKINETVQYLMDGMQKLTHLKASRLEFGDLIYERFADQMANGVKLIGKVEETERTPDLSEIVVTLRTDKDSFERRSFRSRSMILVSKSN